MYGIFVFRQVRAVRSLGVDARVLCPVPVSPFNRLIHLTEIDEWEGVPVHYLPFRKFPLRVSPGVSARLILTAVSAYRSASRPPDLVHAHWLFPTGWAALRAYAGRGLPIILSARGSDVHTYPQRDRRVGRLTQTAVQGADIVTAVSEALARSVAALGQSRLPVRVMYNGVDTAYFRPTEDRAQVRGRLGLAADRRYWISVSRLAKAKGTRDLIHAFAPIARARKDVDLIMLGAGPDEPVIRQILASAGLAGRVILPGGRPPDEVLVWLQASDAFVLASHNEGLPNVVLEAMATGLPVVATDVGGTREVVEHGVTGLLVPPRDVGALGAAMLQLVDHSGLIKDQGQSGKTRAQAHFGSRLCARRWVELYEEAVTLKASARESRNPQRR